MGFMTLDTLGTLAGASFFVTLTFSVVNWALKGHAPRLLMLAISIGTSVARLLLFDRAEPIGGVDWLLAMGNGFLICATALGLNTAMTRQTSTYADPRSGGSRVFLTRW